MVSRVSEKNSYSWSPPSVRVATAVDVTGLTRRSLTGTDPGKSTLSPTRRPASGTHWLLHAPVRPIRIGVVPGASSVVR